jgi:small subunit ribosomal protein S9
MAKTYATGKRKSAIAKVWVSPGSGKVIVNGMDLNTWLG